MNRKMFLIIYKIPLIHISFFPAPVFKDHPTYGMPSSKSNAEINTTSMTQPRAEDWRVPSLGESRRGAVKKVLRIPLGSCGQLGWSTKTHELHKPSRLLVCAGGFATLFCKAINQQLKTGSFPKPPNSAQPK